MHIRGGRMTAEQFSLTGVLVKSKIYLCSSKDFLNNLVQTYALQREHRRSSARSGDSKKFHEFSKLKGRPFGRISPFTLEGIWRSRLVLCMTLVHKNGLLEVGCFALTHVLVLVSNDSDCWLGCCVCMGRKTGWSDLVRHRWRTGHRISLVEICLRCLPRRYSWMLSRNCCYRSRILRYDWANHRMSTPLCSTAFMELELELEMSAYREVEL
ncbi:hypothetical protein Tco_0357183 [Tanacetum coccineum]